MKKLIGFIKEKSQMLALVIVGAVIGGVMTGAVMAAVPDANGVIHACYTTGLLAKTKIIDSATESCSPGQTAISWNQSGIQGPQGETGAQGPAGTAGPASVHYEEQDEEGIAIPPDSTTISAQTHCDSGVAIGVEYVFRFNGGYTSEVAAIPTVNAREISTVHNTPALGAGYWELELQLPEGYNADTLDVTPLCTGS